VTRHRTTAVHVTPVKIARNGIRWAMKKGMELTGEIRPCGSRSSDRRAGSVDAAVEMANRPVRARHVEATTLGGRTRGAADVGGRDVVDADRPTLAQSGYRR
jgi:hypothetical protein